jgi:hypothetical protein
VVEPLFDRLGFKRMKERVTGSVDGRLGEIR